MLLTAFGLWSVWTLATWMFEGRVEALPRPDALIDRLLYVGVANIGVGIVGTTFLVGRMVRRNRVESDRFGFGSSVRTLIWVPVAVALGLTFYIGQGAPSKNLIVILNIYAQVLVVSIAKVLVAATEVAWMRRGPDPVPMPDFMSSAPIHIADMRQSRRLSKLVLDCPPFRPDSPA